MRRTGLLVLVWTLLLAPAATAQVNVGVFGGVNLSNLVGDKPPGTSHETRTGLAAGLVGEFHLGDGVWLSFQPMYLQRGTGILAKLPSDTSPDTTSLALALDYVTLPVMLKFVSRSGKVYVAGGLDVGYAVNAVLSGENETEDVADSFKKWDVTANFAFGTMLPIGRPRLTLEARYAQSIVNLNEPQLEMLEELPLRSRSTGLQLLAGLLYPLGGEPAPRAPGREAVPGELRRPRVGEHTFMPNNLVRDPVITTFVRNSLGLGKAVDIQIPLIDFDSVPLIGLKGDLLFAFLDFEYQGQVKDWLAARGEFRLFGRLGSDVGALLAEGVTAATAFDFGWLIRLFQNERTLLSADIDISNNSTTAINVSQFVDDVIEGNPAQLVRSTPALRGGGGLRFAWGASPFFGTTLIGKVGYGESVDRTEGDNAFFRFGATLDFDFSGISAVPIGAVLAGRIDTFPEGGGDSNDEILSGLLRIAYNGRNDFILALDFTFEQFDSRSIDQTIKFGSTGISMRYYF